ncbi:MAG: CBS domain-containing protein [Spirochaetales bacterium]|nr:CBS domain-containing protein [Spirochaetales bacterium]
MKIDQRMNTNLVTTNLEMSIQDAADLMESSKVHCLPVLDDEWHLVGIISDRDILRALPSPLTSLSIYETKSLMANLTVSKIIRKDPITVQRNVTIEQAAKIMVEKDVQWLPVLDGSKLVGIVSRTDMIKTLLEVFGTTTQGCTINFTLEEGKGKLEKIIKDITSQGFNIIAVSVFSGSSANTKELRIKVSDGELSKLKETVKPYAIKVLDTSSDY